MTEPNGLLAAGADISAGRLIEAYRKGIFPWYGEGQPVLWWSPDPRMVLQLERFRLSHSLIKKLRQIRRDPRWQISLNRQFEQVMRECARPRPDQDGTWITDDIIASYVQLHQRGAAVSVEVSYDGELVGGLYGVTLGRMFYGESMFARRNDASKIALALLVFTLRSCDFHMLDCQQNTSHLASMGACEIDRSQFIASLSVLLAQSGPDWSTVELVWPSDLAGLTVASA